MYDLICINIIWTYTSHVYDLTHKGRMSDFAIHSNTLFANSAR